ncbi:MAG: DsbA family oxidoreductase [Aeromicrobium sp.]|nr:MAG: DsbA family oxidoreductase [Aeromicrobium sp.]
MASIKIDIWSDIACPWCFIGKRRLEAALAQTDHEVEIEYHSFELAPDTPTDFEGSEVDFLVKHKGMPAEQVQQMLDQVTQIAADEGLTYDFSALQHTNTRKAHEALHYAKVHGKQSELKERLLRAYFIEGKHVGRIDELVKLGTEVGLSAEDFSQALASETYANDVTQDIEKAREMGISGVPFFAFNMRFGVAGAQSPQTFIDVLNRAVEEVGD